MTGDKRQIEIAREMIKDVMNQVSYRLYGLFSMKLLLVSKLWLLYSVYCIVPFYIEMLL